MNRVKRGFTVLEALVSALLLATTVVASLGAIASITKAESSSRLREHMQRLAIQKYDELNVTGQVTQSSNGDFNDQGISDFVWSCTVRPSGTDSLNYVGVTVSPKNATATDLSATVETLQYAPNTTTGGTSG